jgi:hypothetical protein
MSKPTTPTSRLIEIDKSELGSHLRSLRSTIYDIRHVTITYDASHSQEVSPQLPESPPHYSAFWYSVEDIIYLDETKEDDYATYYNFSCSPENSGSEILQSSPDEDFVGCYIPDDCVIISFLQDAEYIRDKSDVYINSPCYVISSYAFADARDNLKMIDDISFNRQWEHVGNLEVVKSTKDVQITL